MFLLHCLYFLVVRAASFVYIICCQSFWHRSTRSAREDACHNDQHYRQYIKANTMLTKRKTNTFVPCFPGRGILQERPKNSHSKLVPHYHSCILQTVLAPFSVQDTLRSGWHGCTSPWQPPSAPLTAWGERALCAQCPRSMRRTPEPEYPQQSFHQRRDR